MRRNFFVLLMLTCFLLVAVCLLLFSLDNVLYDSWVMRVSLVIAVVSLLLFLSMKEENSGLKGQSFKVIYLLILGFFVVHFQIYFDYEFGSYYLFNRDYLISPYVVNKAALVSLIGFLTLMLGYGAGRFLFPETKHRRAAARLSEKTPKIIGVFSVMLLVGFVMSTDTEYFSGGYGSTIRGYLSIQIETLLGISLSAAIIANAYVIKQTNYKASMLEFISGNGYLNIFSLVAYLVLMLLAGDRGPLISFPLMLLGAYVYSHGLKIGWMTILIGAVSAATFITALGLVREINDGNFIEKINEVRAESRSRESDHSVFKVTHELAISVRAMHAAVLYTQENGFKYGLMQFNQILNAFPGAGYLFREALGWTGEGLRSTEIITSYLNSDHGLGTTVVADIYIDFSWFGVAVSFLVLGGWLRLLDVRVTSFMVPSLLLWVCFLVFLSKGIYIGRSTVLVLFRDILIVYAIIGILGWLLAPRDKARLCHNS